MHIRVTPQKLALNYSKSAADSLIESYQQQLVLHLDATCRYLFDAKIINI